MSVSDPPCGRGPRWATADDSRSQPACGQAFHREDARDRSPGQENLSVDPRGLADSEDVSPLCVCWDGPALVDRFLHFGRTLSSDGIKDSYRSRGGGSERARNRLLIPSLAVHAVETLKGWYVLPWAMGQGGRLDVARHARSRGPEGDTV